MKPLRLSHRVALLLSLACLAALPLAGCTTNAATGKKQFNFLSRADEIALGAEAGPELTTSYGGVVPNPAINAYVSSVGMKLVPHTESDYKDLPWKFTLLNSDVINAFALPGGQVFISRALAERFTTEAELAGVLGHEVGHVTAEHADRAVARQLGLGALAIGASILAGDDRNTQIATSVLVSGAGVYSLSFSRDQEDEADSLGMRYMVAAGYDPIGMLHVMEILADASKGNDQWEILSTHPNPESRIKNIKKRLEGRYKNTQNNPEFGTFASRFKTEFLNPISSIPQPPKSPQSAIDLTQPHLWCAHCAAQRALAKAE